MGLYFKITIGSLLLLQACQTVSLEESTASPKTIDPKWLRVKPVDSKKTATEGQTGEDRELDGADMESSDDNMIGLEFNSMSSGEGGETDNLDGDANVTSGGVSIITTTMLPVFSNETAEDPELPEMTVSQHMTTTVTTSQINETGEEEESQESATALPDSITHPITLNYTASPDFSNNTDLQQTALVPETTQEPSPGTDVDNSTINATEDTVNATEDTVNVTEDTVNVTEDTVNATEVTVNVTEDTVNATATEVPQTHKPFTTDSSATELPSETTVDEMTPAVVPSTTAVDNMTDSKDSFSGSNSERGLSSDYKKNTRSKAWGAILGTAVAVSFVGLVVYVILRKRNQRDFSHRKLVEEFTPDPVLRLDNSEPLDLNYGGSAYYNPGLQMDNIQMDNYPRGHNN